MKRNDISGFELKLFGYTVELVTERNVPVTLGIWKGTKLIRRFNNRLLDIEQLDLLVGQIICGLAIILLILYVFTN